MKEARATAAVIVALPAGMAVSAHEKKILAGVSSGLALVRRRT